MLDSREHQLAGDLGAQVLLPGLLYREEVLPADYRHGGEVLERVHGIGHDPLGLAVPAADRGWLFFDTETTGLAGGTGTLVFLFGAVHLHGKHWRLRQWLLTRFSAEAALLHAVQGVFDECALLVSYNGKSFDLPLLRTRHRLHQRILHEQHLTHLDLLHPARAAFAARWPDVRLQTAEQRLCAYQRSDDLPGSEAPRAFTRWLRVGCHQGLLKVARHHRDDVLSLVTLCTTLAETYRNPQSRNADEEGIARRLQKSGYRVRAGQAQLALLP